MSPAGESIPIIMVKVRQFGNIRHPLPGLGDLKAFGLSCSGLNPKHMEIETLILDVNSVHSKTPCLKQRLFSCREHTKKKLRVGRNSPHSDRPFLGIHKFNPKHQILLDPSLNPQPMSQCDKSKLKQF